MEAELFVYLANRTEMNPQRMVTHTVQQQGVK